MIAIDLSKKQALDSTENTTIFFIIEEAKNGLGLFTRECKSFVNVFYNNFNLSNINWLNIIV